MNFFKTLFQTTKDKEIKAIAKYLNDQEDQVVKIVNCMADMDPHRFSGHRIERLSKTYGVNNESAAAAVICEVDRLHRFIKDQEKDLFQLKEAMKATLIAKDKIVNENHELINERDKLKIEIFEIQGRTTETDQTTTRRNASPSAPVTLKFEKPIHKKPEIKKAPKKRIFRP